MNRKAKTPRALSMDETEKRRIAEKPAPFEGKFTDIFPKEKRAVPKDRAASSPAVFSLCGGWEMAESGYTRDRLDGTKAWKDAVRCDVPCSVHTALLQAGKIPDPAIGLNDKFARENSYKVWWLRRTFSRPKTLDPILRFEGVCYSAQVWLNGRYLGYHKGMFGAFEFAVEELLQEENTLVVKIDNAPANAYPYSEYADNDEGWKLGTVINCVYGWHYACIPSRGIWAPVGIYERVKIDCERPFYVTVDEKTGYIDMSVAFRHTFDGSMELTVSPENCGGGNVYFSEAVSASAEKPLHVRFRIPEPKLWWPNGHGEQNLYRFALRLTDKQGNSVRFTDLFGIRKAEWVPTPSGPDPEQYNWQLRINGKDIFIKGANWCTTDFLLRFEESKYVRYLTLAKEQGVNFLRAWGGGMPESETFYDLCDRMGLTVFQEWPTGWDSHKIQPLGELTECVYQHTVRLRNRASLVLWAGGNESAEADGYNMEQMAKISYETDGSRPFHRSDPCGKGTVHNYATYWEMKDMDATLDVEGVFMGEYGMASAPVLASVNRYTLPEERGRWDPDTMNSFTYHTPRFNQIMPWGGERDMKYLSMRVYDFNEGKTEEDWIYATQLAQATVLRHPIEKFRANYPDSTGICYYKMNDVFPACGWSVVDFYGVQKPAYYAVQDAYAPFHACIVFRSLTLRGDVSLPVYLLNDSLRETDCKITVTAYDGALKVVAQREFTPPSVGRQVTKAGTFELDGKQTENAPLFICVRAFADGVPIDKTFYWLNFVERQGCLFRLPQGSLQTKSADKNRILLQNCGTVPLVGVTLESEKDDTTFTASDNFLWLDAGETQTVAVSVTDGVVVSAWNLKKQEKI